LGKAAERQIMCRIKVFKKRKSCGYFLPFEGQNWRKRAAELRRLNFAMPPEIFLLKNRKNVI